VLQLLPGTPSAFPNFAALDPMAGVSTCNEHASAVRCARSSTFQTEMANLTGRGSELNLRKAQFTAALAWFSSGRAFRVRVFPVLLADGPLAFAAFRRDDVQPSISLDSATLEAVSRWARGILGAPRRFAEHMVATKAEDEVILRLATEIERRSLVEQRAASGGRVGIEAQIDPAAIDPFAVDESEIRLKTEHIETCRACKGSRLLTCGKCSGEGRHKCDICSGSGKVLKLYKKSSRMINCQACRSKGHVQCELCAGKKAICCQACEGSGTELVWLAMSRSKRTELSIVESAVLRGHRQLLEPRLLEPKDLSAFADVKDLHSAGPLPVDVLHSTEAVFVKEKSPVCEPRVERIASQQLVRFSALRRDVTYEMALQRATFVLSGKHLQGSPTPESTKPIRTRLWIWSALSAVIGVLVFIACGGLLRKSPYYAAANNVTVFIGMLAVVFGVLMAGTALRVLRPGFRLWPLRRYEKGIALALLLDLAALPVPRFVGRPSIAEARAAFVRGDLARSGIRDQKYLILLMNLHAVQWTTVLPLSPGGM
jgi:hypothetical protein